MTPLPLPAASSAHRRRMYWTSAFGVVMVGLIVVLANALSAWIYARFDLTHNSAYSLSRASKKLVREIDGPLLIKAYFTRDLPAPYNAFERYVQDLLVEYRSASRGRIKYEFVLTYPAAEFERRAMAANLAPVQFEQMGSDELAIRRGFMGLVLYYRDRNETIPVVRNVETLEYEITSKIARMIQRPRRRIALTQGHGELNWRQNNLQIGQDAGQLFEFQDWSLPQGATQPMNADALLVVGPRVKFDETSLRALDQAIQKGIPTGFLVDIRHFLPSQFTLVPQETGLQDFLSHYGASLGDRIVLDRQSESVGITQNVAGLAMTRAVRYPFVPLITDADRQSPLLRGLETVGLPFATFVDPSTRTVQGAIFKPIFRTSAHSWLMPASQIVAAPDRVPPPVPGERVGPFTLGVMLEGRFTRYFASQSTSTASAPATESPKTRILVLGTSQFLNGSLPEFAGASGLTINLLSDLSNDEILSGIRSKGDIIRPLRPLSPRARDAIKLLAILGVPLLPVLCGLLRWRSREAWRARMSTRGG